MKLSNTKNNNDKSTPFLVDEMESEESEDNLTLNQQFKKTRKMKKIKLDNQEQEVSNKKKRKKFDVEKTDLDNQEQEVSNKKKRKKFDVEKTDLDDQKNKEDKAGKSKEGADKKKRKVAQEPKRQLIHHKYSGKKIVVRCSSGNLISVIDALTDEQRKAVKDMGFESILKLSIHSIPTSLGFYILRNYDPSTNEIYDGEDRILITSELIQEVFRIPNGGKPVLHCEKPQITNPVVVLYVYEKERRKTKKNLSLRKITYSKLNEYEKELDIALKKEACEVSSSSEKESEDEKEKPKARIKKEGLSNERMIKKKGSKISEGLEDATEDATEDLPATEEVWAKMLEKELQDFDKHANEICLLLGKASKDYPEGALIAEKHEEWKFLLKKYFESVANEKHGAANEREVDECFIEDETKEGKTDETEESLKKDEAKDGKTDETKEGETDETHESLKQNETKDGKTDDTESSLKKHETKDMGTDEKKDEEPESSFFSMNSSMIEHIDDSIAGHNEKMITNYIGAPGFELHLSQPTPPSQESNVETSVLGSITEQGNEVVDFQEKETVDENVNNNSIVLYNKETEMKKLVADLVENINKDDILNKKESEVKKTEVAKIAKDVLENEKAKKDVFEKLKRPTIVIKTKDLQLQKKDMAEGGKIVGTHIDQLKAKKQFNVPNAPKEVQKETGKGNVVLNTKQAEQKNKEVVGTHIDQLKAKKQFNVPNAPKEREVLCMAQPLSAVKPIVIDERPKRKRAKAGVLCSPFMERPVVLEEKRTKTENDILQFIFAAHGPTWDILFSLTDCITVLKIQMETMRMGIEVHVDVINAWSHILNHEEQFRDKGNPNRLFCTSPMIHRDTFQKDESIMLKEFTSNMNELLTKERLKDITEHDMKITFEKYLESISHPKAKSFKKSTLKRMEMDWRTENNHIDCGIFLMRHMETYLGIDDWNCGFDKEENGNHLMLIEDLRRKYIAKILLHDTNESKEFTVDLMKKYAEIPGNQKRKVRKLQMTSIRRITERLHEEFN
ncbi:hypothetical protein SSX86_000101 [Deinandra increscens subsp. villosa]|uniref:Ubiquitin-like protease family profile domain-containing protein n=1 Tax=Deinandra increscens subsp. villosa TaxID=3103831 RepID=A0AAP0DW06_9ASTR